MGGVARQPSPQANPPQPTFMMRGLGSSPTTIICPDSRGGSSGDAWALAAETLASSTDCRR